jgi:myo-inositol-1(or 4)-monophosphatase
MISSSRSNLLRQAEAVVRDAGAIIAADWRKPKEVYHKGRIDLLTRTDMAVEAFLKEHLQRVLPEANTLAEETANTTVPGELTWIIDPVDGTTNFAHGFPFVATSVALWCNGRIVLGIVNAPLLGECFTAVEEEGACLNGQPFSVSRQDDLELSLIATGFPYGIKEKIESVMTNLERMLLQTQGVRRAGSAALDLAFTACGRFDGFYESDLKPWDTAAGWLLVKEAGGQVSTYDSKVAYTLGAPTILASNGRIHEAMSDLLKD